jgi:hypothetical protein
MDDILRLLLESDDKPEKDVPMGRFGNFRVRALDDAELRSLRERATFGKAFDVDTFRAGIIAKGCVNPQWNHPELLAKYNTSDAAEVVKKRLLPGEKERLSDAILSLSGFGEDETKAVEDVKN